MLLTILLWILIGALAGWIAGAIMGVREGFWSNVLIGIVGAILGGVIFRALNIGGTGFGWTLLTATIGAVILLALLRAFRRPARGSAM